jgi:enolase
MICFVTNPVRFSKLGIEHGLGNGILIKLNQIGSVSETCQVINMAKEHEFVVAVSHRSGETNDDFIADLSVASQAEFIKLGAPARGERVAKFNRLLEIKESLEG